MIERRFEVDEQTAHTRLDKLLRTLNEAYSRQEIQKWIKSGHVRVNKRERKPNYVCKIGDEIVWELPQEKDKTIKAEPIPLSIVHEDEALLVINKPKGMVVHPTESQTSNTLVNGLLHYCNSLSDVNGIERPGIVHRLDKDTSGLIVIAKNNDVHLHLQRQFQQRTVKRIYEAIVHGVIQHTQGIIRAPIGRNPYNRLQMAVVQDGKEAETKFRVLERFRSHTHVECELLTGRTHQIRVHLKYLNHPIVGDELYSRGDKDFIEGQALFAKTLGFVHPKTETWAEFSLDRPKEFSNLLQRLKNSS